MYVVVCYQCIILSTYLCGVLVSRLCTKYMFMWLLILLFNLSFNIVILDMLWGVQDSVLSTQLCAVLLSKQ